MKLDPLAEMHLLLREYGWENIDHGIYEGWEGWTWSHSKALQGDESKMITTHRNVSDPTDWFWSAGGESEDIEELREYLKELARG